MAWVWGQGWHGHGDSVGTGMAWAWGQGWRGHGDGEGTGMARAWGQGWRGHGDRDGVGMGTVRGQGMMGALERHGDSMVTGTRWGLGRRGQGDIMGTGTAWEDAGHSSAGGRVPARAPRRRGDTEETRGQRGHIVPSATPPHPPILALPVPGPVPTPAQRSLCGCPPWERPAGGTQPGEPGDIEDGRCPRTTMASLAPVERKMSWGLAGTPSRRWRKRATSCRTSSMPGLAL